MTTWMSGVWICFIYPALTGEAHWSVRAAGPDVRDKRGSQSYQRGRIRFQLGSTCLRISASSSRLR